VPAAGTPQPPGRRVDYSVFDRPERYRHQRFSSIYHVSYGDRPLYGGGSAARSQTDSFGLRS